MNYLSSEYYKNNDTTEKEYDKVFKRSWLFAGLTNDLARHNDFVTLDIFGRSIVVQNFNGKLSAFQNVCAHRFNKIQTETRGNRAFFCKYHGWTYNSEGKPVGIPQKDTFVASELECAHLQKHLVDVCGKFVFVKIDTEDTTTLREFLADFYEKLIDLSQHFDKELLYEDIYHEANWKLLIENVNEGYHCPLLHRETLIKAGFCTKFATDIGFSGKHSKWDSPKITDDANSLSDKKLAFLQSRSLKHESFYHQHIYPTFLFASTEGYLFYIGNILPIDAEKCILRFRYYSPVLSDNTKPFLQKAFFDSSVQTGINIMKYEDRPIIEQCQKGLQHATGITGVLSPVEEVRLIKFQEDYLNDMNHV